MQYTPFFRKVSSISYKGYQPRYIVKSKDPDIEEVKSDISDINTESDNTKSYTITEISTPQTPEEQFRFHYSQAGGDEKKYQFFKDLAKKESGFNYNIQNLQGAPAFGYFQFGEGDKVKNISHFANTSIDTFRNDPILQVKSAEKLAASFSKEFTDKDRSRAKELGFSESALIAGAGAGGVKGVRKLLHEGISVSDKHWSKDGKTGTDVLTRMKEFNNYFKEGGVLKYAGGTTKDGIKQMYKDRNKQVKYSLEERYGIPISLKAASKVVNKVLDNTPVIELPEILQYTDAGGYSPREQKVYVRDISDLRTATHELGHAADGATKDNRFSHKVDLLKSQYSDVWKRPNSMYDDYDDQSVEIYADTVELRQYLNKHLGIPYDHIFTPEDITKIREALSGKKFLVQTLENEDGNVKRVGSEFDSNNNVVETEPSEYGYKVVDGTVLEVPKESFKSLDSLSDIAWLKLLNETASTKKLPEGVAYAQNGMQFVPPMLRRNSSNYNYREGEYDPKTKHWSSRNPETGLILKSDNHPTLHMSYNADTKKGYHGRRGFDGRLYSDAPWEVKPGIPFDGTTEIKNPDVIKGFKNIDGVYNHLISLGASPEEAAGWTGVFIKESGLNHDAVSNKGAKGIAQLLGTKLENYNKGLKKKNLSDTGKNQITWVYNQVNFGRDAWQEYYNSLEKDGPKTEKEINDWNSMKDSKGPEYSYENYRETVPYSSNPADIAEIFTGTFERPKDFEADIPKRRAYAQQVYYKMNPNENK